MDLLETTKKICELYDIWPSRSKGQNFLIKESVYDEMVSAGGLDKDDTVLEVGPGLGFLTAKLAKVAKRVIAVELDDKIAAYLKDVLAESDNENIEIVNADILRVDLRSAQFKLKDFGYRIVANLPYNISSFFLRQFLSTEPRPQSLALLLQKEVAERICAAPGEMSLLALSVQFYAEPEIVAYVSKNDFWPVPKVDSAIIKLKVKSEKSKVDEKRFFQLAKFGFSAKRKMLKNNLAAGLRIEAAEAEKMLIKVGLDAKVRAEDLSIDDWKKIAENLP